MILVRSEEIEAHRAQGLWGCRTLDSLLEFQAKAHPDRVALLDAPDRARWTAGTARRLTWAQAATEVERLAAALRGLGLGPDGVVGLHVANTTDSLLAMLAALRAGLVLAPLPLQWTAADIVKVLSPLAPRALIGASRIGPMASAELLAEAAAGIFSVRHVAVLDDEAPDGITPLADYEARSGPVPPRSQDSDDVASITQDRDGLAARSHNQWIANGLMVLLAARMPAGSRILSPLLLSNSAALAGAVAAGRLDADPAAPLRKRLLFRGSCFRGTDACPASGSSLRSARARGRRHGVTRDPDAGPKHRRDAGSARRPGHRSAAARRGGLPADRGRRNAETASRSRDDRREWSGLRRAEARG
jgi:hypothetical protein